MIYTIYKISISGEDYIGSTKDLKQRKAEHKRTCNTGKGHNTNYKLYQHIRENGGWDCCEITPVEEYECETKRQAECREEYWRREYKSILNSKKAYETEEEKIERNKEYYKTKCANKTNCECGGKYDDHSKSRHFRTKLHQEFISRH